MECIRMTLRGGRSVLCDCCIHLAKEVEITAQVRVAQPRGTITLILLIEETRRRDASGLDTHGRIDTAKRFRALRTSVD